MLTDAEAAELHELDARSLPAPAASSATPGADPVDGPDGPVAGPAGRVQGWAPEPAVGPHLRVPEPAEQPEGHEGPLPGPVEARASGRRRVPRRLLIPILAVVALAVGLVIGRISFGQGLAPSLNAQQQDAWTALEASGKYDAGSVHLVGSKYGVDAWTATRGQEALECLILTQSEAEGTPLQSDPSGQPGTGCVDPSKPRQGQHLQAGLDYAENGVQYSLWATLVEDINGNPAMIMQRQDTSQGWDWRSQYDEAELALVDVLQAAGFDGTQLSLVGYDGDTPVWTGYDGQQPCVMIVHGADVLRQCGQLAPESPPLELTVGTTTYSVQTSVDRGTVLTVYGGAGRTGVHG